MEARRRTGGGFSWKKGGAARDFDCTFRGNAGLGNNGLGWRDGQHEQLRNGGSGRERVARAYRLGCAILNGRDVKQLDSWPPHFLRPC